MENPNNIYYFSMVDLNIKSTLYEVIVEKTNAQAKSKEISNRMATIKNTNNSNIANQKNKIPSGDPLRNSFYYYYITDNLIFIFL
jgi:hypothetical protein